MANLFEQYQAAEVSGKIQHDDQQVRALCVLQQVSDQLIQSKPRWFGLAKPLPVRGAYLYGEVGTGKTFLMDLFYNNLKEPKKMRMHFYRFMEMIHAKLQPLQGKKNPLTIVAKEIAAQVRVICFDEFFVVNIVDAMLLGNLLKALYAKGITLVATSNVAPSDLYKEGLQYEQFVPAIKLIEANNNVVRVDSGIDYRLGKADYDRAYFYPQDPQMQEMMLSQFKVLGHSPIVFDEIIQLDGREVQTKYCADKAIWFEFKTLCGIPRSQKDYIELANQYDYVFMSGLRTIKKTENDLITNFVKLIDVFYDDSTKLIILADVPINQIYLEGLHNFEFERTTSRLYEMQSEGYLTLAHF